MSRALWIWPALVVTLASACNTTHYVDAGEAAWSRGERKLALANWRAARRAESRLLDRRARRRLNRRVNEAVTELAQPALKAAAEAVEAGNGGRALDIVLPLYGGRGLYRNLAPRDLRDAREALLPLAGPAISLASGIDVRALARGEGAVDAASQRVAAVRRRIERFVPRGARRALLDLLGNVARPAIARGWRLVDQHMLAGRTEEAVSLGDRLASVFPDDRELRARAARTRRRAAAHHRSRAQASRRFPGILWGHLALAARYDGSARAADALRAKLRATQFRVTQVAGCNELAAGVRRAIQRGSGGVPVTVDVQLRGCRALDKHWTRKKRVSWLEWRTRQVRVRERYTAYVSRRKCRYVQRYANTTCTTSRAGNGWVRRTCRPNYSTMQQCRNVSEPVTRTRWVTKTQRYQVRLTLVRTIHHYATGFAVAGKALVRWPGGGRTVTLSYRNQVQDHGYNDRAGRRNPRRVSVSSMHAAAIAQLQGRVHGLANAALAPKAHQLRQRASLAAESGQDLLATDLALQAWILGASLRPADRRRFAALFRVPASLASRPGGWQRRARRAVVKRASRPKRRAMPLSLDQAFASDGGASAEELVNPHLPEPNRHARGLYRELRGTAWRGAGGGERAGEVGLEVSQSALMASRLGLTLRTGVRVGPAMRLYGGVEVSRAGFGTRGWQVGVDLGQLAERGAQVGVGLRYAQHDTVPTPTLGGGVRRSSNLDLSYLLRAGGTVGFWMRLSLNLARWVGDDALVHYHPQAAGLDLRLGPVTLRAGAVYHAGGGGLRFSGGLSVYF